MKYIECYFNKLREIKGVQNVMVFNSIGVPVQSTFKENETICSVGLFDDLITRVKRSIQIIDQTDDFASMRLKTKKFEILISKDMDDLYFVAFQRVNGNWNMRNFYIH